MDPRYMVCAEASKMVKGVFRERTAAIDFARRRTRNGDCFSRDRLSEVLLVFEVHDDGSDVLLARL